jgi:hypothetical protein
MNLLETPLRKDDISQMQRLDKHFRTLTAPVFKKHGFAQGDVLANWPQIVGDQVANVSRPEKIRWPRDTEGKSGGTLHVKVQAGRGLELEYLASGIIERVNGFLGYGAVTALKVLQAHDFHKIVKTKLAPPIAPPDVLARVAPVADPDLAAALTRLGAGISAQTPRSPQAK